MTVHVIIGTALSNRVILGGGKSAVWGWYDHFCAMMTGLTGSKTTYIQVHGTIQPMAGLPG